MRDDRAVGELDTRARHFYIAMYWAGALTKENQDPDSKRASRSWRNMWDETLNGFKCFINDLREKGAADGIDYLFSLTTFDTLIDTPCIGRPIDKVDENLLSKFGPRGNTALYDAVGQTIENTDKNRHGAQKIICVIVTDGHENSSREWTKDSLNRAVEFRLNAGDWSFIYLGTQPETWDDAAAIGVGFGSVAAYDPAMAHRAYRFLSESVHTHSVSPKKGTRSMFASYRKAGDAVDAGMSIEPDQASAEAKPPRRWR